MKKNINTVPVLVRVRTFLPHTLIALIALVAYILVFRILAGNTVRAYGEIRRVNDSPVNEIVLSYEQNPGEAFYYLKNYAVTGSRGKNALSDVLMVMPGENYSENSIYFSGALAMGSCAVSANIAEAYGLRVGERAQIIGTDKSFLVERIITAQAGIDEDYLHEGIVILSYDEELLDKSYLYMSFDNDGDAYRSLYRLIYVENMTQGKGGSLLLFAIITLIVMGLLMLMCETLLFRSRLGDYESLVALGVPSRRLLWQILGENLLKYTLPLVIVMLIYSSIYGCYRSVYYVPTLLLIIISVIYSFVYSFVTVRRICYVRPK